MKNLYLKTSLSSQILTKLYTKANSQTQSNPRKEDVFYKDRTDNIVRLNGTWERNERRNKYIDNPVVFVTKNNTMINDTFTIMVRFSTEDFFFMLDNQSSRKSCQAYIGVVEDYARGTLHYHILLFG